jgi:hypothetical protein
MWLHPETGPPPPPDIPSSLPTTDKKTPFLRYFPLLPLRSHFRLPKPLPFFISFATRPKSRTRTDKFNVSYSRSSTSDSKSSNSSSHHMMYCCRGVEAWLPGHKPSLNDSSTHLKSIQKEHPPSHRIGRPGVGLPALRDGVALTESPHTSNRAASALRALDRSTGPST